MKACAIVHGDNTGLYQTELESVSCLKYVPGSPKTVIRDGYSNTGTLPVNTTIRDDT